MRTPKIILAGLATLGLSVAAGPAAQASITYVPVTSIGAGELSFPVGVAVNQATGNVYVGNFASVGVQEYDRNGNHVATFDTSGLEGVYDVTGTAVDPVNGNLYVIKELNQIETLTLTGKFISEFSIAGAANYFGVYTFLQLASDSSGSVYLPNAPNNEVQKFSPGGTVLATITGSGAEALKEPTGVAVGPTGDIYVADNGNGRLEEFSPAGVFIMALGTGVDQTTSGDVCTAASGDTCGPGSDGSQSVALDGSGDIFVGENNGSGFHVVLYSPAGEKLSDFGLGTFATAEWINTLAVSPSGLVYVTDSENNLVRTYAQPVKPSVVSESAVAVTHTTATLRAAINPNNFDTHYRFEYGTSTAPPSLLVEHSVRLAF